MRRYQRISVVYIRNLLQRVRVSREFQTVENITLPERIYEIGTPTRHSNSQILLYT